jgi:tRNA (uracil-5-)-methyltransferase TRM9
MCEGYMDQKEIWNRIAPTWNEYRDKISPSVEKFVSERKGKILDLGCGSGRNFVKVNGLDWTAVDFSEKMVDYAMEKSKNLGMEVDVRKADSTKLPFETNSFDVVLCFAVLHCVHSVEKREKTLKEIYRVLKSGGEALISVWGRKSPRMKNKDKECFVSWTSRDGKDRTERYVYIYDLDELVDLCKKIGFEIVNSWEERNVNVIVRKFS